MKLRLCIAVITASFAMPSLTQTANAQEQVIETLICQSSPGSRSTCPVNGEIISAGIQRQREGTQCFLNYTWGFAENGLWTGNGCSAEFAITVERAAAQPVNDPSVLRNRLRTTRAKLREARKEIAEEQENRRLLEAELAEVRAELREAEDAAPKTVKRKRKPQMAIRSVAVCSNKAIRDLKKTGAEKSRVAEILMARPTQGTWLVIGRTASWANGERSSDYFRCWTEKGKVVSFEYSL